MAHEIKYYEGWNNTAILHLATTVWKELQDNNWDGGLIPISWDDHILAYYEYNKPTPLGLITWQKQDWCKTCSIKLGYVLPELRRQGMYTELWKAAVVKAKEQKLIRIEGSTRINNTVLQETAIKLGRKPLFITYEFIIE
jgi:GNAT superfamily N-acetyltransferase